jgi:hypothetical protein
MIKKLSPDAENGLRNAIVGRGRNKGSLRTACPPMETLAAAAWQGAMMACNPHKVSVTMSISFTEAQRSVFDEVYDWLELQPASARRLDRDRTALEQIGAW